MTDAVLGALARYLGAGPERTVTVRYRHRHWRATITTPHATYGYTAWTAQGAVAGVTFNALSGVTR